MRRGEARKVARRDGKGSIKGMAGIVGRRYRGMDGSEIKEVKGGAGQ